jgi:4-hydroxybenzoate polyprenyltransferase
MPEQKPIQKMVSTTELTPAWGFAQFKHLFIAMRPQQWVKNLLLFIPLLFSLNHQWDFSDLDHAAYLLGISTAAFFLFCLLSSTVYLINDVIDAEVDRQHPKKRERPIASRRLKLPLVGVTAVILPIISLTLSYLLSPVAGDGPAFGIVATLYFTLTLSYTLYLKKLVIIDIFTVASGFVLRTVAGAVVLNFPISPWLYLCTLLLALFLSLGKRRHEMTLLKENSGNHRRSLLEYSPRFIDDMIVVITAAMIISYSFYTFSAEGLPGNHIMMLTIPFVLYGTFRYLYLIHIKGQGGSPEELLFKDKPLVATVALWLITSFLVLLLFSKPV